MKVSIFIPVHNRAENTKKLLDELVRQQKDYPETEILATENGSTEDMSFLDDYDTVVVSKLDIAGVYHAQNYMLSIATGDYYCFIDNDDWIPPYYLKVIYEHIESGKDWYVWKWYSDDTPVTMEGLNIKEPLKLNWAMWGYCMHSKLFKDVHFDESKMTGDDVRVMFSIITAETEGEFIDEFMYRFKWMGNDDSVSHIYNQTHAPCCPENVLAGDY